MPWFALARTAALWNPDLRGLAVLRMALGAILLLDALARLASAPLLYTDIGLLPRAAALASAPTGSWSLHLAEGSTVWASLLTLLQGLAAAALMLGRRTRWATLACWLLAISAAARNPLVVTPGDGFALLLLFWGLWLPWGARLGMDGPVNGPVNVPRGVGIGLGLQVLVLAWILPPVAPASTAPLGTWLLPATVTVLVLLPGPGAWPRRVALLLYLLFCAWLAGTADLGTLPWLAMAGALPWIDTALWDRLGNRTAAARWRLLVSPQAPGLAARMATLIDLTGTRGLQVDAEVASARVQRLFDAGARVVLIDEHDVAHRDTEAVTRLLRHNPLWRPLAALADREPVRRGLQRWLLSSSIPQPSTGAWPLPLPLAALVLVTGLCALGLQAVGRPGEPPGLLRSALVPVGLHQAWLDPTPAQRAATWLAVVGEGAAGPALDALSDDPAAIANYGARQVPLAPGLRGRLHAWRLTRPGQSAARAALAQQRCRQRPDLVRVRVVQVLAAGTEQRVLARFTCTAPAVFGTGS